MAGVGAADAAEDRAADHARALAQAAQRDLARVEPERAREVVAVGLEAGPACAPWRRASARARRPRARPAMSGCANRRSLTGDARLRGRGRRRRCGPARASEASGWRPAEAGAVGFGSSLVAVGLDRARGAVAAVRVLLGHRVAAARPSRGARRCSGCRRRPGAPCSGRALSLVADLLDHAVVDRDHRRAAARVDVDRAAVVGRLDHVGRVLALLDALEQLAPRPGRPRSGRGRRRGSGPR